MKKKLLRLSEKQAKVLEIFLAIVGIILTITVCVSSFYSDTKILSENQNKINDMIQIVSLILMFLYVALFYYIGDFLKIEETRAKSKKYPIKCSSFAMLKTSIFKFLEKADYSDSFQIENKFDCDIFCFLKKKRTSSRAYILIDLSGKELTDEFRENYLDDCLEYIANKYPKLTKKSIYVTHIICVSKTSDVMRKITERVVLMERPILHLPVVVSLSNQQMYVAPISAIGGNHYEKMFNMLKVYIKNQDEYL